jgi:hypothetical protein
MNRPTATLHVEADGGGADGAPSPLSGMDTPGARLVGAVKVARRTSTNLELIHAHMTSGAARPSDLAALNKLSADGITVVVIGASGDLAKKKTYPAIMELFMSEFLPKHARVVGYARSAMTNEALRAQLRPYLLKTTPGATEVGCFLGGGFLGWVRVRVRVRSVWLGWIARVVGGWVGGRAGVCMGARAGERVGFFARSALL